MPDEAEAKAISAAAAARFPLDEVHKALVEAQFGHKGKVFLEG